ncbi:MAG: SusC/RagA family TonB-linked outer membrane protein [Candidatus Azobacteroides sp.]|nr:SusC/RagA family TonB-linked outer membrane protein [Candidatus Azobacteroides sp.]
MKRLTLLFTCFLISMGLAIAQNKQVSGTVTDENGEPIVGASVIAKGNTTIGTATDESGKFSLTVPESVHTLIVRYIGYAQTEASASANARISLTPDTKTLNEVVVTALGISRDRKAIGYAIAEIKPDEATMKGEPDMLKALQGRVAGVDIRSSQGMPGASTRINVRGNSSFFGDNQPLIVVDGIPLSNEQVTTTNPLTSSGAYSSGFSSIDPNDIESMSVLKGSSASALWGSRASNGVVIIKTKSGSTTAGKRKTEVSLTSSWNWESIANLPDYQNTYGAGSLFTYSNANGSWGPRFDQLSTIPAWPDYYAAFPELFPDGTVPYVAQPNNVNDLFKTGFVRENSINMRGGTEKNAFNVTLSNLDHSGYVPSSSYIRNSISLGGNSNLSNKLNIRGSMSFVDTSQKGTMFGENQVSSGSSSAFARSLFLARNWNLAAYPYEDSNGYPVSTINTQYDNPFWMYKHNVTISKEKRVIASFGAEYAFTPWLKANYTLGTNYYSLGRKEIVDIGSRDAGGLGRIKEDDYTNQMTESTLLLTFEKTFAEAYSVKATIGNDFNETTVTRKAFEGDEIVAQGTYNLSNTKTVLPLSDAFYRNRIMGVFADITLGYKSWAYVTLTGRNDWSSTLPKKNRSYFYPAVSGSLVFSDAFNIKSDAFSFGKIRVNWARVGRDADPYSLYDIYAVLDPVLGQPAAGISPDKHNPNLKPEFTRELELGTQLSFFKNRIGIDFAWYDKVSTNQIMPITLPYSSGFLDAFTNAGKLKNTGVEIDLMLKPVVTQDWDWELHGIFTKNNNTVKELIQGVDRIPLRAMFNDIGPYLEPGKPFGYIRGTVNARDAQGNLLIDPSTGLLIPATDMAMIGDPNPDYKLGISSMLKYKGFFLSALFDLTEGGQFYSVTINSLLGRGVTKDTEDREHAWVIPGYYGDPNTGLPLLDSQGKQIPNTSAVDTQDLYFGNSFAINGTREWSMYDATVYHLREVSIGYVVPAKYLSKTPFGTASITLSGRNLWHFAPGVPKHTNFDPEVNSYGATTTQGFDFSAAPSTRRYGFTVNLTF